MALVQFIIYPWIVAFPAVGHYDVENACPGVDRAGRASCCRKTEIAEFFGLAIYFIHRQKIACHVDGIEIAVFIGSACYPRSFDVSENHLVAVAVETTENFGCHRIICEIGRDGIFKAVGKACGYCPVIGIDYIVCNFHPISVIEFLSAEIEIVGHRTAAAGVDIRILHYKLTVISVGSESIHTHFVEIMLFP